jgi:hypothetical protein
MTVQVNMGDLEGLLLQLDWTAADCKVKITNFRRTADAACDSGTITLKQWRVLQEKISVIQEKCSALDPDAWRHPPAQGQHASQ